MAKKSVTGRLLPEDHQKLQAKADAAGQKLTPYTERILTIHANGTEADVITSLEADKLQAAAKIAQMKAEHEKQIKSIVSKAVEASHTLTAKYLLS